MPASVSLNLMRSNTFSLYQWESGVYICLRFFLCSERTRNRPLASGRISVPAAWTFLLVQFIVGTAFFATLNNIAYVLFLPTLTLPSSHPFAQLYRWHDPTNPLVRTPLPRACVNLK